MQRSSAAEGSGRSESDQGKAPQVLVPQFSGKADDAKSEQPPPIPTDVDRLLEEWLSGTGDAERRAALLAALDAIVFPGEKPAWVVAMRQRLLTADGMELSAELVSELEKVIQVALKTGTPTIRYLLPWIESALRAPSPSALLRWGGLQAWIGSEFSAGPTRVAEIAQSLVETLEPLNKDREAKKVLQPILDLEPIFMKALVRETEVAKFLVWGLPRTVYELKFGPELSGVWLAASLSTYALQIYDGYFGKSGSGAKKDVLFAAGIWMALDERDQVAKLIWAMATGSAELENDKAFGKAVAAVKAVAPWFTGLNWQAPRDPVMQRLQRLRLPEICGDMDVEMRDLQQTYVKRSVQDLDMAFPNRKNIGLKIAGLSNSMKGRARDLDDNRSDLDENDIPVDIESFSRRIKQLEMSNNIDGARLAKWWRARSRL